jgi:hypothetical protein
MLRPYPNIPIVLTLWANIARARNEALGSLIGDNVSTDCKGYTRRLRGFSAQTLSLSLLTSTLPRIVICCICTPYLAPDGH